MPGGCSNEATYVQHCYTGGCVAPVSEKAGDDMTVEVQRAEKKSHSFVQLALTVQLSVLLLVPSVTPSCSCGK